MEEAYLAFLAVGNRGQFSTGRMDHPRMHRNSLGDNLEKLSLWVNVKGTGNI